MADLERADALATSIRTTREQEAAALAALSGFAAAFYPEVEEAVKLVSQRLEPRRAVPACKHREVAAGLQSLVFDWLKGRVFIVPIAEAASPNPTFELMRTHLPVGRAVVFYQLRLSTVPAPVCQIYVAPGGQWRLAGLGLPMGGDSYENADLPSIAMALLERLNAEVHEYHAGLSEVVFDPETHGVRDTIGFHADEEEQDGALRD